MGGGNGARFLSGRLLFLVVAAGLAAACGTRGVYHVVRPGENLYRIGKAYGVSYARLARFNRLRNPATIHPGQRLFIPGAHRRVPVRIVAPRHPAASRRRSRAQAVPRKPRFAWPLREGVVTSKFGPRDQTFHDGIDIAASAGTPIYAAGSGEVVYASRLPGYGRLIILRHAGGYATVYAHNRENRVRVGQRVREGTLIGVVGDSGRTTAPNLHFEVRQDNEARDPLLYLRRARHVHVASGKFLP